uniref:Centriolar and ciliogenesis-associated protein HYLS1 C-terminal domain-containing protein n=1 Tax=Ornithorhynchus anatinus TaxID=9258 RepID=A0A6I8N6I8_ORNAN
MMREVVMRDRMEAGEPWESWTSYSPGPVRLRRSDRGLFENPGKPRIFRLSTEQSRPSGPGEVMEALMGPRPQRWDTVDPEDRLAAAGMTFTRVCASQGEGDSQRGARPPSYDPYSKASVTPGGWPLLPRLPRSLAAEGAGPPEPAPQAARKRPVMKRKVLRRKPDGEVQVSDESALREPESSSESDPERELWDLRRRLMGLRTYRPASPPSPPTSDRGGSSDPERGYPGAARGDPAGYLRHEEPGQLAYEQDLFLPSRARSFILPPAELPGRVRGKVDRVARYLAYKRDWESLRLPGETAHRELRWGIREQMLDRPEAPPRPHQVYVPNTYLVPTEKKRSALRWGVRCDLALGIIPRKAPSL